MSLLGGLRRALVIDQRRVAIFSQQEKRAKIRAQAERIDPEIRQIHEVNRIGQQQIIPFRLGVEPLP